VETVSVPAVPDLSPAKAAAPTPAAGASGGPTALAASGARIALLLPLHSESLGQASEAIRAGFMAAYERESDGISIDVIETADAAPDVLTSYTDALPQHDLIVGPLSRAAVAAIAQSGAVSKPTIALNQPEPHPAAGGNGGSVEVVLPPNMLSMGLSVEDEARQIALWASADKPHGKAFIISTAMSWQRRAAKAFAAQWQRSGLESQTMELSASSGFLSASGLVQLKTRIQNEKPALLFVALDAAQTGQIRTSLGHDILLYGTSQLNPYTLPEQDAAEPMPQMNGVRLLDLPWQLQADHTAVMVYPRPLVAADQKSNADLERLYALGIDAYRVARAIAVGHDGAFKVDGVTGKLSFSLGQGVAHFDRQELPAIYQDGVLAPLVKPQ
jgi:outer membrane PBP1 activator LpoA protein